MVKSFSSPCPLLLISLLTLGFTVASPDDVQALSFVDSWNFNNSNLNSSQGNSTLTSNFVPANITYFGGTTINVVGSAPAGNALSLQAGASNINNSKNITLQFNLSQYSDPILTFATQKTSTGFNSDLVEWSINGTTFSTVGISGTNPYNPATSFALQTFDFSNVNAIDSASTALFRITFNGATSSAGNNRIDNIQLNATLNATPVPFEFNSASSLIILGGAFGLRYWRKRCYH
ncbi:PFE-CTERM domain-containing protein [Trichormus variabilis]|uniref:PEP-CTERM protein-sorting domain-containing protein n=1 Tax=Trichormus variabilis SAG 1403-4b TaxID=447716 RepID=A0A433UI06_ANAVA|nr:hypothetical protein [Trichormus variabilis]MBD2629847.1 hypothetical protein [Trichormus variabilis FACHB-164]RUS93496.1 hypothetical protein DSM107003_42920 [Trichormus variabilis SAG 1403-4b]